MARNITTDHETIRTWVLERNGIPVLARDEGGETLTEVVSIRFSDTGAGTAIEWDEFFTIFETKQLAFVYDPEASPEAAAGACSFISRVKQAGTLPENENTEMPEDRPEMDENLYPSHG